MRLGELMRTILGLTGPSKEPDSKPESEKMQYVQRRLEELKDELAALDRRKDERSTS